MGEKKEQKIVVCLSLAPSDRTLILNGIRIAVMFKKELCLFYNYARKEKKDHEKVRHKISELSLPIIHEIPGLRVSTLLTSEKKRIWPDKLSDDQEAILFIAPASGFSQFSSSLAESPVPFLFVHTSGDEISQYKRLILPVDFRRENSESALWSSYFGRYNQAEIVVVAANDKNREEQKKVNKNVLLIKKLFGKFKITNKIYKGTRSSFRNASESLALAKKSNSDLLIILGSSTITPLDRLLGLPERKILDKAGKLPVLVVNPRRDNYLLCD